MSILLKDDDFNFVRFDEIEPGTIFYDKETELIFMKINFEEENRSGTILDSVTGDEFIFNVVCLKSGYLNFFEDDSLVSPYGSDIYLEKGYFIVWNQFLRS